MQTHEITSATGEAPTVLALPDGQREGWVKPDLVRALREIDSGVSLLDFSLGAIADDLADGDALGVLYLLSEVRESRKRLAQVEAIIETKAARLMSADRVEAPDLLAIRRSGRTRKAWDHETVIGRVAHNAGERLGVNAATGEVDEALYETAAEAVRLAFVAASPSWKVTGLRAMGVRFDDACETEETRRTVEVLRGAAVVDASVPVE